MLDLRGVARAKTFTGPTRGVLIAFGFLTLGSAGLGYYFGHRTEPDFGISIFKRSLAALFFGRLVSALGVRSITLVA
jgi:hypothetical protein